MPGPIQGSAPSARTLVSASRLAYLENSKIASLTSSMIITIMTVLRTRSLSILLNVIAVSPSSLNVAR